MTALRMAYRFWRRRCLTACICIFSLSVTIAITGASFLVLDALVLTRLPIATPERIVRMASTQGDLAFTGRAWDYVRAIEWRSALVFATSRPEIFATDAGRAVSVAFVSDNYFLVLGLTPHQGVLAAPGDHAGVRQALISFSFWRDAFGGRGDIIGQTLRIGREAFLVRAVLPPSFTGLEIGLPVDIFLPLSAEGQVRGGESVYAAERPWLNILGRLSGTTSIAAAQAELSSQASGLRASTLPAAITEAQYLPGSLVWVPTSHGMSAARDDYASVVQTSFWLTMALLVLCCVNVAFLYLIESLRRAHDLGVRLSLGAGHQEIAKLALAEVVVICAAGATIGIAGSLLLAPLVTTLVLGPTGTAANTLPLSISIRTAGVYTGVALLSVVVIGLPSIWVASHGYPAASLHESKTGLHGRSTTAPIYVAVALQVALCAGVLVGGTMLIRSYVALLLRPTGLALDELVSLRISGVASGAPSAVRLAMLDAALQRLRTLPETQGAAAAVVSPLSQRMSAADVRVRGSLEPPTAGLTPFNLVSPDFFRVVGTRVIAGRDFTDDDVNSGRNVVIVNMAFVNRRFDGIIPIGQTLDINGKPAWIVGVVENYVQFSLRESREVAMAFGLLPQWGARGVSEYRILLRSRHPSSSRRGALEAVREVAPTAAADFASLRDEAANSVKRERVLAYTSVIIVLAACLVSLSGVFAGFAFLCNRRKAELALRVAFGASGAAVARVVLIEASKPLVGGVFLGATVGVLLVRRFEHFLYGVSPSDWLAATVAIVALEACCIAAAILPVTRLRFAQLIRELNA